MQIRGKAGGKPSQCEVACLSFVGYAEMPSESRHFETGRKAWGTHGNLLRRVIEEVPGNRSTVVVQALLSTRALCLAYPSICVLVWSFSLALFRPTADVASATARSIGGELLQRVSSDIG